MAHKKLTRQKLSTSFHLLPHFVWSIMLWKLLMEIYSLWKKNELPQFVCELLKSLSYSEDLWNLTGIPIYLSNLIYRVEWICLGTSESRNVRVQRPDCDNISLFVFHWLQWGKSSILHLLWFQSKRRAPDTILVLWKRERESYFIW